MTREGGEAVGGGGVGKGWVTLRRSGMDFSGMTLWRGGMINGLVAWVGVGDRVGEGAGEDGVAALIFRTMSAQVDNGGVGVLVVAMVGTLGSGVRSGGTLGGGALVGITLGSGTAVGLRTGSACGVGVKRVTRRWISADWLSLRGEAVVGCCR